MNMIHFKSADDKKDIYIRQDCIVSFNTYNYGDDGRTAESGTWIFTTCNDIYYLVKDDISTVKKKLMGLV